MASIGIPWQTIKPVILAVVTDVAVDQVTSPGGIFEPLKTPKWNAEWIGRSATYVHPIQRQALYLRVMESGQSGWDDVAWESLDTGIVAGGEASGTFDVFQVVRGLRRIVVNVQSWVAEDTDSYSAFHTLERLRTMLDMESSRSRFLEVELDFTESSSVRDISRVIDKKMWSIASMDLTFHVSTVTIDPNPTGYIERVFITSHENNAGVEVDPNLRMIDEHLPDFTERTPHDAVDLVDALSYVLI